MLKRVKTLVPHLEIDSRKNIILLNTTVIHNIVKIDFGSIVLTRYFYANFFLTISHFLNMKMYV